MMKMVPKEKGIIFGISTMTRTSIESKHNGFPHLLFFLERSSITSIDAFVVASTGFPFFFFFFRVT